MRARLCLVAVVIAAGCGDSGGRRIKLAGASLTAAEARLQQSVVRVDSEEQRSVAILDFVNETGDPSLDWLRRGLSDMLATEMAQSPYFKVLNAARVDTLLGRAGRAADDLRDDAVAAQAASDDGLETFLSGSYHSLNGELIIDAELRSVSSGELIRDSTVRGPVSLERVFSMVSDLSRRLREDLRGDLEAVRDRGLRLSEMTASVEAFRHYSRGLENYDKMLTPEADYDFARAVEADPTFAAAHLRLAGTRSRLGDRRSALTHLKLARQHADRLSHVDEVRLSLSEAELTNQLDRVQELAEELLAIAPDDMEARMAAAHVFFHRFDLERALVEYEAVLKADPERKLAYNQLAYTHAYRGDFDMAIKYLRKYQKLTPNEPNAFDSMGEVLMMAGRFDDAIAEFELALQRWPQFHNSLANLGRLHAERGELDKAIEYNSRWLAAAATEELRFDAQLHRSILLWRFGRYDQAQQALDEARALRPKRIEPYWLTARLQRDRGDDTRATAVERACLEQHREPHAADDEPCDATDLLHLCVTSGLDAAEALTLLDELKCPEPLPAERDAVRFYRAVLALRAGDTASARAFFEGEGAELVAKTLASRWTRRDWVWKYIVESVAKAPLDLAPLRDGMQQAARRFDRRSGEVLARLLELQQRAQQAASSDIAGEYRSLGIAEESDWLVMGPFANDDGFRHRFPPELDARPGRLVTRKDGERLLWRAVDDGVHDGYLDLTSPLGDKAWTVGYAQVAVTSPSHRVVQIRLGTDAAVKMWVNDEQVWGVYRLKGGGLDTDIVKVALRPGDNRILVKLAHGIGDVGFYLRVTDDHGEGFPDLDFRPVTEGAQARLHRLANGD